MTQHEKIKTWPTYVHIKFDYISEVRNRNNITFTSFTHLLRGNLMQLYVTDAWEILIIRMYAHTYL